MQKYDLLSPNCSSYKYLKCSNKIPNLLYQYHHFKSTSIITCIHSEYEVVYSPHSHMLAWNHFACAADVKCSPPFHILSFVWQNKSRHLCNEALSWYMIETTRIYHMSLLLNAYAFYSKMQFYHSVGFICLLPECHIELHANATLSFLTASNTAQA
jgi:hypothetical protein